MANIIDKTAQIRNAVYGKDVRESIASGIEAISDQQDLYEQNLTNEQSTFQNNITNQQNIFETNINNAENVRVENEINREDKETIRQLNEVTRQDVYNDFRDFVNTAQQINRVPYLFDGGDFGDISSPVLTLNGGDF